jgi:hypothetical protein
VGQHGRHLPDEDSTPSGRALEQPAQDAGAGWGS